MPTTATTTFCKDLPSCFQALYNLLFALLIALAFLYFLYGAFLYLLSAGGVYSQEEAKKRMINSIIALLIALGMPMILYMINPEMFKVTLQVPEVTTTEAVIIFFRDSVTLDDEEADRIQSSFNENRDIVQIPNNLRGIKVVASDKRINSQLLPHLIRAGEIAANNGCTLVISSAYRSIEKQTILWNNALKKYGSAEKARKWVAPPGKSPHNFGLALDMRLEGRNCRLSLIEIMCQAGFVNYAREGWHFEMFTNRWKRAGGRIIGDRAMVQRCKMG
jgi:hypothetical protein